MEDNRILRLVYTFFLGILLAIFVGVGINTFYAPPPAPEYPAELNYSQSKELTAEQQAKQTQFDQSQKAYNEKMKPYNRNVSIIALVAALVFLAASIIFQEKLKFLSDGIMLGGLFTLLYSIGRGFASEDSKYVFVVVTVGLIVVVFLGYRRFVGPGSVEQVSKPKKSAAAS